MKKSKIIASVCTLILTLACLTFGVYSAVKTSFTASGSITFNAYSLDIDVKCTISGLKDGATKTLYGTTFLNSANVNNSARTNYVSDGAILNDGTSHFNLSASGATMTLGELAFDELSDETNKIEIKFEFWNYSNYVVKAEANTTVGAEEKLIYTTGGATILNEYTATEANENIESDYGWFPIQIFTKSGATAIESSENSISISIKVSPEGIKFNETKTEIYDTTVVREGTEDNEYNNKGITYSISGSDPTVRGIYQDDNWAYHTPDFKETLNLATSCFGVDMKSIEISIDAMEIVDPDYRANIKKLSLPAKSTSSYIPRLSNLVSIVLPESVTSIGDYAFQYCSSLTTITIPSGVTSIGESAFDSCRSLTTITIPEGVTSIGESAFFQCDALAEVYNLSSLKITAKNSSNGLVAYYVQDTDAVYTSASTPSRITTTNGIKYYEHNGKIVELCATDRTATTLNIKTGCTAINQYAFAHCRSLTTITIPEGVTSIGDAAFYECSSLTTINFEGTKAQWNAITFDYGWNRNSGAYTIHCTDGDIAKS